MKTQALMVSVGLAALTASSYILGIDRLLGASRTATSIVLLVAFAKVFFITRYFMDIRHAPHWLSLIINSWIVITGALVITLYIV
jgi:hypothetical protein